MVLRQGARITNDARPQISNISNSSNNNNRPHRSLPVTARGHGSPPQRAKQKGVEYRRDVPDVCHEFAGEIPDDDPVWLVLDCYSAHRDKETLTLADSLGIKLIFIPAGFTDELQPLDRSVFGVLKGYLRRMWRERFIDNPETKFNKALAVELLIPAWEKISSDLIAQSWSIYAEDGI